MSPMQRSLQLIETLQRPEAWPRGETTVRDVTLIETHISWVLLTGESAYKIRKPVDLGFLDFSTLARRDHCAHEEIRLNRRFAPEIYRDVVRITGSPEAPSFNGSGPLIEVAVRMRQFDPGRQLDEELAAGRLTADDMVAVADEVAGFQLQAPRSEAADSYGTPAAVLAPVRENFVQLRTAGADLPAIETVLEHLEAVSEQWAEELTELFMERRAAGFIREGHGDLHLANLTRLPEGIRAFDCIEFSPALRWIDVICDLAFLFMDLAMKGRRDLAWTLLNAWLARSGDFRGVALLRFYAVYRALVRAKVAALRRGQLEGRERDRSEQELLAYLDLAGSFATPTTTRLILTCGVSGSGKSWLGARLAAAEGWVHVRSDVERKRLFGMRAEQRSGSAHDAGIYTPGASELVYRHLLDTADLVLGAGHSVLVDATFLGRSRREPFIELARQRKVPVRVLYVTCARKTLHDRVRRRQREGGDPSEADELVLAEQLQRIEVPEAEEGLKVIEVDSGVSQDLRELGARLG